MRRPQPARGDQQVGLETFRERGLQLLRPVPDHDDPRRLEPARRQLACEKGPVGVLTPAPRQLAAGDDDRCSGAQLGFGATVTPLRRHEQPALPAGAPSRDDDGAAVQLQPQVGRRKDVDPELAAREQARLPAFERALVDRLADARAAVHGQERVLAGRRGGDQTCDRRRLLLRRGRRQRVPRERHVRRRLGAEAPGDDHERSGDSDDAEHDEHRTRGHRALAAAPIGASTAWRERRLLLDFSAHVAGVELVHVELPVEAEILGVGAQEALDVGLGREHLELLLLERAQVLAADLRGLLDLRKVECLAQTRLTEAVTNLEQGFRL